LVAIAVVAVVLEDGSTTVEEVPLDARTERLLLSYCAVLPDIKPCCAW
jgi:hypothetical protein